MADRIIQLPLDVDFPQSPVLKAGDLTCIYDNGSLRSVNLNDIEIIRMVYAAVRDEHWETVPFELTDERIEQLPDSFLITCNAIYKLHDIGYKAEFIIKGTDNTISFKMKGTALSSFRRNRIGICLLHPLTECAGKPVNGLSSSDEEYKAQFPETISPHQPFKNIATMHWKPAKEVNAGLQFKGDVFETEDQRNWSDGSYKTYSTPLDLPRPVMVYPGDLMEQEVVLSVDHNDVALPGKEKPSDNNIVKIKMPYIGYERPYGSPLLTFEGIELLRKIPFEHYRVILDLGENWSEELQNAVKEAEHLGCVIELVVIFGADTNAEIILLIDALMLLRNKVASVLVLSRHDRVTPPELFKTVAGNFRSQLPYIKIGYGTDGSFAGLNRNLPGNIGMQFLSFSLNPQVHAFDNVTITENLAAQSYLLQTIWSRYPGMDIHVAPITLDRRYNADAVQGAYSADYRSADHRQYTAFAAFWALHSLVNLSKAASVTFFQTTGERGLINFDPQTNEWFLSPFYKVMEQLKNFAPKWVIANGTNSFFDPVTFENECGEQLIFKIG